MKIKLLQTHPNARLPLFGSFNAAGADLYCVSEVLLESFVPTLVPLGFKMAIPPGFEAQIRPRSGLALSGVGILNSPGTIDADYRGEVGVIMMNYNVVRTIHCGDRIAQMVIQALPAVQYIWVSALSSTERAAGGFGSTGF